MSTNVMYRDRMDGLWGMLRDYATVRRMVKGGAPKGGEPFEEL